MAKKFLEFIHRQLDEGMPRVLAPLSLLDEFLQEVPRILSQLRPPQLVPLTVSPASSQLSQRVDKRWRPATRDCLL